MEYIYNFTKDINSDKLKVEIAAASLPAPLRIDTVGTNVNIVYSSELTEPQQTSLAAVVAAHVKQTSAEGLSVYLQSQVFPFVNGVIAAFAAENITMGITQAGKTGHVLALFTKKYPVPNETFQNNLKAAMDTGSLYVARDILQHIRDNPSEFDGLSPYVTDARLLAMKNKIEAFLGLPLST